MIFGYIRVSTKEQSLDSQKNSISRYCVDRKLIVDEWFELEMSSRQTTAKRRIDELLSKLRVPLLLSQSYQELVVLSKKL